MPVPNPDGMWSEVCLIQIARSGGSNMEAAGRIISHNINFGTKGIEVIPTVSGARLIKFLPQEETVLEFEAYFLEAGTISGTTLLGGFDLVSKTDAGADNPTSIPMSTTRNQYRVVFLWTNSTQANLTPDDEITGTATIRAFRVALADGYFTEIGQDWSPSDGLKFTMKYVTAPFDSSGNTNILVESITTAAQILSSLASYTAGVQNTKFYTNAPT